jgi:hypothetical protein
MVFNEKISDWIRKALATRLSPMDFTGRSMKGYVFISEKA